jgi:hypothetical protein
MSAQCRHPERSEGPHKGSLIAQVTSRVPDAGARSLAVYAARGDNMSELDDDSRISM